MVFLKLSTNLIHCPFQNSVLGEPYTDLRPPCVGRRARATPAPGRRAAPVETRGMPTRRRGDFGTSTRPRIERSVGEGLPPGPRDARDEGGGGRTPGERTSECVCDVARRGDGHARNHRFEFRRETQDPRATAATPRPRRCAGSAAKPRRTCHAVIGCMGSSRTDGEQRAGVRAFPPSCAWSPPLPSWVEGGRRTVRAGVARGDQGGGGSTRTGAPRGRAAGGAADRAAAIGTRARTTARRDGGRGSGADAV